jgi:phospholipase/carboxylesterase
MVPIVPDPLPTLSGRSVLISNGDRDPLVPVQETQRLASLFRTAGADITVVMQKAGHQLIQEDIAAARDWLQAG